ncbi:L-asparagine permease [Pseudarthrobacter sulfonivorans]|uniref:L-asparagine permease n=1 Tax=Pseudarthrobacter sulfonivorans TaxID=121292 RepID=A0A0U3QCJ5_9MICC|nr:amino acid permease [Pseudarthrobacter sulfonivorans]ALV42109.1 L-asparagine permease [Pseudarthrobacter sulfonivorans]
MINHNKPSRVDLQEQAGYHKGLSNRQVQMIGIGGAIGTGLFLGAGGRLAEAGPALFVVYALCGIFAYIILRALGELVMYRPSSGSFVSYAREFYGEKAAYVAGWIYALTWGLTALVDITAVAVYLQYWTVFTSVPQWVLAFIALVIVTAINLVSVKLFGEMEFWFALIKVLALVSFLVIGTVFLAGSFPVAGQVPGLGVLEAGGGLLPNGALPLIITVSGVMFAYGGIELIGTAAGEAKNPEKVIPKAVNAVIFRIAVFYVGSTVLLALLLPFTSYSAGVSPFVTFFASIGVSGEGDVMNLVVVTAAMSSLNAGLYSTGRIYRSLAIAGSAPRFMNRMNKSGVPYAGVLFTSAFALIGVAVNAIVPKEAFEITLNATALAILAVWATIILCQLRLQSWAKQGLVTRPAFRLPGSPWTSYLALAFLLSVLVIIGFQYPTGTYTVGTLVIIVPALILGWYAVRGRVSELARQRESQSEPATAAAVAEVPQS